MDWLERTYFPMFDQDTGPPGEPTTLQLCRMLGGQRTCAAVLEKSRNLKHLEFLKSKPLATDNYVS